MIVHRTFASVLALLCLSSVSFAQTGTFEDIVVDKFSTPFIRYNSDGGPSKFLVDFGGSFQIYDGTSYSFRLFESAPSEALVVDVDGVSVTPGLNVIPTSSIATMDMEHGDGSATGIISLDGTAGLFGGGIGLKNNLDDFPFYVFNNAANESLSVGGDGVGVGTFTPAATLHVVGGSGFASPYPEPKILVEDASVGPPQLRRLFELINNGGSQFTFTDTSLDSTWAFSSNSGGAFSISLDGTGGAEMVLRPTGQLKIGPGAATVFDLRPNGNLTISGTLSQSSDRNMKTAVRDIDATEVLNKIGDLPISSWQFKSDVPAVRHVGPMAQDFHASFGLGENERSIATTDGIGVSLVGIGELKRQSDARQEAIATMQERIDSQKGLIDRQREKIEGLEARLQRLETLLAHDHLASR